MLFNQRTTSKFLPPRHPTTRPIITLVGPPRVLHLPYIPILRYPPISLARVVVTSLVDDPIKIIKGSRVFNSEESLLKGPQFAYDCLWRKKLKSLIKRLLENELLLLLEVLLVPLLARHALKVDVTTAHRARLVSFIVPSLDASGAECVSAHEVAVGVGRVAD